MIDEPENPLAFPNMGTSAYSRESGMTLRDYFAAQSLTSIGTWMPTYQGDLTTDGALKARASWAYRQADAMLAERLK